MVFDRYIFKNLAIATIFMTLTLVVVIFLTQSLRFLELVIEAGARGGAFWILTFLALPRFFEVIVPIACMSAVLFVYNKLIMDSEMIVMRGSGSSPLQLSRPAITLAFCATLFLLFVTLWLAPVSLNGMKEMRQVIKAQISNFLIKERVFNTIGNDLTVYVESRGEDGALEGLIIHDAGEKWEHPITVIARKGIITTDDDRQRVLVYDGSRQDFNPGTGVLNRLDFERYTIDFPEDEAVMQKWREPDQRTFFELLNPDPSSVRDRDNLRQFQIEAHKRILSPFLALTYTLVALAFLLIGSYNRRGQGMRLFYGICTIVVIQGLYLFAFNLSSKSMAGLALMYALVFVPGMLSLFALSGWSEKLRRTLLFGNGNASNV